MAELTSFQKDVRPLFTERDIRALSKAFNPAGYNDVKAHAAAIYDRIRGIGGAVMLPPPPRGEGPWPLARIEIFAKWMITPQSPVLPIVFRKGSRRFSYFPLITTVGTPSASWRRNCVWSACFRQMVRREHYERLSVCERKI